MPRLARSRHHQRDVVEGASAIAASRARCRGPARSSWSFDTLATQVFTLASLYRYEEAELSALIMVVVSLARDCRRPPRVSHELAPGGPKVSRRPKGS